MKAFALIAVAIVATVSAGEWGHQEHYEDYHGHPVYKFDYSVHDPHTHDEKTQWESRDGEHVKGSYTLVQPDHKTRTVKYEAGKHGFNAQVHYDGHGHDLGHSGHDNQAAAHQYDGHGHDHGHSGNDNGHSGNDNGHSGNDNGHSGNDNEAAATQHGHHGHEEHYEDFHGHPKYHFDYAVHDPHTHDVKSQWETRDGEQVKGSYTLIQPDHKTRTVKYESDKHGFNAEVKYEGHGHYHHQKIGGTYGH